MDWLFYTADGYRIVLEKCRAEVGWLQWLAILIALIPWAAVVWRPRERIGALLIGGALSMLWDLPGVISGLLYWPQMWPYAYGMAALFFVQSGLILLETVRAEGCRFAITREPANLFGIGLMIYLLLGHAWVADNFGHGALFGISPGTALLAFYAIMLQSERRPPEYLLYLPMLWGIVEGLQALRVKSLDGIIVFGAALVGTVLLFKKKGKQRWRAGRAALDNRA